MVFNGADKAQTVKIAKGKWQIVAHEGKISPEAGLGSFGGGSITLPPHSALILARD